MMAVQLPLEASVSDARYNGRLSLPATIKFKTNKQHRMVLGRPNGQLEESSVNLCASQNNLDFLSYCHEVHLCGSSKND